MDIAKDTNLRNMKEERAREKENDIIYLSHFLSPRVGGEKEEKEKEK